MRRTSLVALALAVAVVAGTGCISTAAKQGLYAVTGASSRYYELQRLDGERALTEYQGVEVQPFSTGELHGAIPSGLPAAVQAAIERKLLAEVEGLTVGGTPALRISGRFMDYDPGGSALRAAGFGVDPFVTAQVIVADASTGQQLGVAMVTGTVKSVARTGQQELADGVAKAVDGLVKQHRKKSGD